MKLSLDLDELREHPEIAEQIRVAVIGATCQPEFLSALLAAPQFRQLFKEALTPEQIWLSYAQVQDFLAMPRSTFFEWKERNKRSLVISTGVSGREPRIKLASILAVMEEKAVSAGGPMLPGIAPTTSPKPAATATASSRSRLPAAALREVSLSPRG